MKTFEQFLKTIRKKNGENLLPVSIERYLYFVEEYQKDLDVISDFQTLVLEMNRIIKTRPSMVIYSAFRMYLLYRGVDKKDVLLKNLETPEKNATAFSSKRFLQSKVLSRGELKRLFNESEPIEQLFFSALYDTACRRKELLNIKYGDINFKDNPKNNIYAEVNILGKGAKSRVVYFGKTTVELIKQLRPNLETEDKVFVLYKVNGKPYKEQPQALYHFVKTKVQKVLGRKITPHCYRHTKLTHLADNGADVLGIKNYAGHDNISTTMVYIEISTRMGKIAFENYSKDISELDGL